MDPLQDTPQSPGAPGIYISSTPLRALIRTSQVADWSAPSDPLWSGLSRPLICGFPESCRRPPPQKNTAIVLAGRGSDRRAAASRLFIGRPVVVSSC